MILPLLAPDELCIGVAVDVPDPFAGELADARARFGDPEAGLIPPHVTLLGPMRVHNDDLPTIDAHLAQVAARHRAFDMLLEGSGTFRPVTPVVFVQVAHGAQSCAALADDLLDIPVDYEPRFAYHPHATVAHGLADDLLDAAQTAMATYSAAFEVTSFGRYEHDDGGWRPARTFALG
ncbi:MAG: 2'-5' RNA ligase family protein [Micrococcales bacterium]|nr:2'-5' RNA ligase family protein [Micrococcales bacterium]MCL2666199.1 2'-5' RNA ligase family protein [Micrococcales bacterium]